jgi:hypothetical protein
MFKKSIAVLLTLMYVSCLNAYAKQSDAQKLSLIDDKIAEYTQEKSQGVTLFWIGLGAEFLSFQFAPKTEYDYSSNQIKDTGNSTLYYILLLGGAITGGYGAWEWYDGAAGIHMWESKRMDVSLGILSPRSLAYGNVTEIGLTARF